MGRKWRKNPEPKLDIQGISRLLGITSGAKSCEIVNWRSDLGFESGHATEELISLLLYLWLRGGGGAAAGMEIPRDIFQGIIFSQHDQIILWTDILDLY